MPQLDRLSKSLPIECIQDIISHYLPGINQITALPNELSVPPALHVDTAYQAMYKGKLCIIHIEMQTRNDPTMPRRIYQYAAQLNIIQKVDIPVYSFVIWFTGIQTPEPIYRVMHDTTEVNCWRYQEVSVYNLTKDEIVARGIGLLPFAAFAKDMMQEDVVSFAQLVQAKTPPELGSLLVHIYLAMIQQRYKKIDPVAVLQKVGIGMNAIEEILWNSSLSDGVKAKLKAKILAETKAEGVVLGQSEGLIIAIASMWPSKFTDAMPEELHARLFTLPFNQLLSIVQHWTSDEPATILARMDRW